MTLEFFGAVILLAISAFMLRSLGWRAAPVFALISALIILGKIGDALFGVLDTVASLGKYADIEEAVGAALKILGLGYLFGISADLCRELGEGGIAKAVEVVGRIEIIVVILPFFEEIIKIGVELIG